jgi:iron complex outermembrane receptor protein
VIAGQGADIAVAHISSGEAFDQSDLLEVGIKGSLIDDSLYFALSVYEQERTDFSAQSIVTNQAARTEGTELEVRWVATDNLVLTLGYSNIVVENLNTLNDGFRFSFIGADDLPGISPDLLYGGTLGGNVGAAPSAGKRAGMPENIWSATGTYDFQNGFAVSGSVVKVDEVASGFSNSVILPEYTLVNLGLVYEIENWIFNVSAKNLTDERYFRANFPNLFGSQIVLPELPRHYQARIAYNF